MITIMMVPLAVVIICYALFTFYMRSKFMERKQVCHLSMCSCTCRCTRYRHLLIVAQQHTHGEGVYFLGLRVSLQVGFYQDWIGAAIIASLVMATLVVILGVAVHELIHA